MPSPGSLPWAPRREGDSLFLSAAASIRRRMADRSNAGPFVFAGCTIALVLTALGVVALSGAFFLFIGAGANAGANEPMPVTVLSCDTADTSFMGLGRSRRTTVTAFNPRPGPVTVLLRMQATPGYRDLGRVVVTMPAGQQGSGSVEFEQIEEDTGVLCSVMSEL